MNSTLETTPTPASQNQKAGTLTGGALTAEALASSKSVLRQTRAGGTTGLQQFFTPPALAELIKDVIDPRSRYCVLDLTAGDGSLLAPYFEARRFGVEMDADQVSAAKADKRGYRAITGDVQHVFPLLRLAGAQFSRIVLNPPFGLTWEVGGKAMNSAEATLRMALALLAPGGQGALIMGRDRATRDILTKADLALAVYAVLDVPAGTFPGVSLPTCVLFFGDPADRRFARRNAPPAQVVAGENLAEAVRRVEEARSAFTLLANGYDRADDVLMTATFKQVQDEHSARLAKRLGTQAADIALDDKGRISVRLSALSVKEILETVGAGAVDALRRLDGQRVNYFALNAREWQGVTALADADLLTLAGKSEKAPALREQVAAVIEKAEALSCPVYAIKPQQRLAFLADTEKVECVKDDPKRGFVAGQLYPVNAKSRIAESERKEVKEVTAKDGSTGLKELTWTRQAKVLDITITPGNDRKPVVFSEKPEDILDLLAHFALPDPGDLATRYPEAMENRRQTLRAMEARTLTPRGFGLKEYQREDVARLLMKQGGLLSWEQGLGKTFGAMSFAAACEMRGESDGNALFIVPQDLIPQWQAEAQKFFGRELVWIRTRAQARQIAKRIKSEQMERRTDPFAIRESAWYITHYEALSIGGTSGKVTLTGGETPVEVKTAQGRALLPVSFVAHVPKQKVVKGGWFYGNFREDRVERWTAALSSEQLCPQCYQEERTKEAGLPGRAKPVMTDSDSGDWDGVNCRACGYTHQALRLKSVAHELTTCFKTGVIVVDEATKIKGESLQSLAVRGLRCRRKLILTGTPVKNYVRDLFHLLGWGLGYNSPRFPFAYEGGLDKFEKDFCVIEYLRGESRKKVLPEVSNLSVLWKMLCGSIVRRRKEDTGEPLVSRTFVPVTVPMGTAQRSQYTAWLNRFVTYYCEKNPDADPAMVEMNSAILGQLHKLEYATTLPTADPDAGYWDVDGLSDMTPKTLKVAEIAARHAARGECVLVGSDVMKTGRAVADLLNAKGIPAAHILEESATGKVQTKGPAARAGAVKSFREGTTRVLCAGVQSINLGHNMDHASVVILDGLPWDFATLDQFLARVHRLTSKRPVTVYVVMTENSMDERKWDLLQRKTKSAELTLDGELTEKDTAPVNLQAILKEMQERGVPAAQTIGEVECARFWDEQTFALRPVGAAIEDSERDIMRQMSAARPEEPKAAEKAAQPALFAFETVTPKAKKAALVQVQQGCLFSL